LPNPGVSDVMSEPRVLTDAELDIVSGGAVPIVRQQQPIVIRLAEEIVAEVFQILFPQKAVAKAD
jgi:hypothetical protein